MSLFSWTALKNIHKSLMPINSSSKTTALYVRELSDNQNEYYCSQVAISRVYSMWREARNYVRYYIHSPYLLFWILKNTLGINKYLYFPMCIDAEVTKLMQFI